MTEIGIAVAAIALMIWLFLKENTRAYLFMKALEEGRSVEEANAAAQIDPKAIPKRDIHATMAYLQEHHRGRQGPLLKKAEAAGLKW